MSRTRSFVVASVLIGTALAGPPAQAATAGSRVAAPLRLVVTVQKQATLDASGRVLTVQTTVACDRRLALGDEATGVYASGVQGLGSARLVGSSPFAATTCTGDAVVFTFDIMASRGRVWDPTAPVTVSVALSHSQPEVGGRPVTFLEIADNTGGVSAAPGTTGARLSRMTPPEVRLQRGYRLNADRTRAFVHGTVRCAPEFTTDPGRTSFFFVDGVPADADSAAVSQSITLICDNVPHPYTAVLHRTDAIAQFPTTAMDLHAQFGGAGQHGERATLTAEHHGAPFLGP